VILKQVAHFYNNIRSQIIDSQMLMLETYARDLEAVIKGPKGKLAGKGGSAVAVTWDSADELDQYANCRAGVLPSPGPPPLSLSNPTSPCMGVYWRRAGTWGNCRAPQIG
jgi:hypothetical protein